MHSWDDSWVHWKELYQAEQYIGEYVYKHSLCRLVSKEKWGSLRYEWILPPGGRLYNVSYIKIPFMSKEVTIEDNKLRTRYYLGSKGSSKVIIWRWVDSWVYRKWEAYGWTVLRKAIHSAMKKFPNVKHEIFQDYLWR